MDNKKTVRKRTVKIVSSAEKLTLKTLHNIVLQYKEPTKPVSEDDWEPTQK